MPNEMITLQLGQCGNQSKFWFLFFQFPLCFLPENWNFSIICSWFWVLETFMFGTWNFTEWNIGRVCNRWWFGSKGCIFLSSWWRSLYSTFSFIGFRASCYSFNYDFTVCQSELLQSEILNLDFFVDNLGIGFIALQSGECILIERWRWCR